MKKLYLILIITFYSLSVFSQTPIANAGNDTIICGFSGNLNAIPSVGTGIWTCDNEDVVILEPNNPNTEITTTILNPNNLSYPYYEFIWTEINGSETDRDTIKVVFARIPESTMDIIPPKCFGEPATIAAIEDSLQHYTWNFNNGIIDNTSINFQGGEFQNFVYWNSEDMLHPVSLISTNYWGCQSIPTVDTVYEPSIPDFGVTIFPDTCMLGKGGIAFDDSGTNSFFWLNTVVGPISGTSITSVYNLPVGEYDIRTSFLTENQIYYVHYLTVFGTANCHDTITIGIESSGTIEANFDFSSDLEQLSAPEAEVTFTNNTIYDNPDKICEWHFNDGLIEYNCENEVMHTYIEEGCYSPYLIIKNENLPECRDTAFIETCIMVNPNSIDNHLNKNNNQYIAYPNPPKDYFSIKLPQSQKIDLTIFDAKSNVVLTISDYSGEDISTDNFKKGTYLIKCKHNNFYYTSKLIIP